MRKTSDTDSEYVNIDSDECKTPPNKSHINIEYVCHFDSIIGNNSNKKPAVKSTNKYPYTIIFNDKHASETKKVENLLNPLWKLDERDLRFLSEYAKLIAFGKCIGVNVYGILSKLYSMLPKSVSFKEFLDDMPNDKFVAAILTEIDGINYGSFKALICNVHEREYNENIRIQNQFIKNNINHILTDYIAVQKYQHKCLGIVLEFLVERTNYESNLKMGTKYSDPGTNINNNYLFSGIKAEILKRLDKNSLSKLLEKSKIFNNISKAKKRTDDIIHVMVLKNSIKIGIQHISKICKRIYSEIPKDFVESMEYIPEIMHFICKNSVYDRNNLSFAFENINDKINRTMYYYENKYQRFLKHNIRYGFSKTYFNGPKCIPNISKRINTGIDITMSDFVNSYIREDVHHFFAGILVKGTDGDIKQRIMDGNTTDSRLKKRNKNFNKKLREILNIKDDKAWKALRVVKRDRIASENMELTPEQLIALDELRHLMQQ